MNSLHSTSEPTKPGKVYLVGSGPGDPGLLTLRGAQCLARADVVLYDYLANPEVLEHCRNGARQICLGRHGRDRIMPQAEINDQMIAAARQGSIVVRLKAGDPAVFAHLAEETAALEAAGVAYEIVPGITAAIAAGSYTGIPLTQGDTASAVALVTGQERGDKQLDSLDFPALAAFPGTLVFYMGVTTAAQWTTKLIEAGKSPATPAAIVRRCSWPDQETITTTLANVAVEISKRRLRPPALVIVGPVAALAPPDGWLAARPLNGQTILVTRSERQAAGFVAELAELGALVLQQPALAIHHPDDWQPVDRALSKLDQFDWLLFTSANGVRGFLDRLLTARDLRAMGNLKIAVVGTGTAEELARYHLRADCLPEDFRAESLVAALEAEARAGKRFLWARANRGRELLAESLRAAGGNVDEIVVYASREVIEPVSDIADRLAAGEIHWVTVTSSAAADALAAMFGDSLRLARLASISPITSDRLRTLGYQVAAEAHPHTIAGLVEAILAAPR